MDGNVDFKARLSSFRCLFNLDPPRAKDKIKSIKIKLETELFADDDSAEEVVEKLNLFTWVEFHLGNAELAGTRSRKVLEMTGGQNVTAVVNQAHVSLSEGDGARAEQCLERAEELRRSCEGEKLMTAVEAELAYSLSRLGGLDNLTRAIEMYTDVVKKEPEIYAWKFGLGLLHRRATHTNVTVNMGSRLSVTEHASLAFELLKDVADHCPYDSLKGRAYAQLAIILSYNKRFQSDNRFERFIDESLKYGPNDARILTDCGRTLRYYDLNKAASLLEKSLKIKINSTTVHHLGLCYEEKAKREAYNNNDTRMRGRYGFGGNYIFSRQSTSSGSIIRRSLSKKLALRRDDPLVVKAIQCYQAAIDISCDFNIPAVYSLGLLLSACGEFEGALKQFNQIILLTSKKSYTGNDPQELQEHNEYFITATRAYEQGGNCLLELAKLPGKTKEEVDTLNNTAEQKLLQAFSLAATLSNLDPGIKRYDLLVRNAFKTLDTKYEEMKQSPAIIKRYLELLNSSSKYIRLPLVIEKLRHLSEKKLTDPNVITTGLESFLVLKQYESAFAFLTCPMIAQRCSGQLQALASKVNLYTAASRLQALDISAKFILKPFFDACFERDDTHPYEPDPRPLVNDETEDTQVGADVLILYDVNGGNSSADVSVKVNTLQEIISGDFGLSVRITDQRPVTDQIMPEEQMRDIRSSRTVLILLNGDPLSSSFMSILDLIPTSEIECSNQGKPGPHILLGLKDDSVEVPQTLLVHDKINLWRLLGRTQDLLKRDNNEEVKADPQGNGAMARHDVGKTRQFTSEADPVDSSPSKPGEGEQVQAPQGSGDEFNECTTAKMSLYCAMVGKKWPL
ncbi:unnamed protein product [Lymnaea stagnalis]|uniref:Tetratricopeptide repeat protein n=1 Tax=Lymnaea stagnalis TaxID=6523 RepID=A0AAV2GZT0_LYMST